MSTEQEIYDHEKRALQLIEEALSLEKPEQIGFLIQACGDDMALREHCLSLLNHELHDDDFIESVYGSDNEANDTFDLVGKVIGNYRIQEKIGQGGAAEVFLAYRNDDIHHQPVALKIIRGWGDTNELVKRIRRERKILSLFQHPNIAKFLDGGNADDGRPYFVLEYVKGLTIIEYCKQKDLSLNESLLLFLDVCDAVHVAHSQLTLHRDLKPSNIIVNDQGVAKLLDFGIAKIYQDDEEHTNITRFFSPMTPRYASPEQIKQMPLSMSSDQYSLGVVLYELLTDQLPYTTAEGENKNSGLPLAPNVKKPSDTLAKSGNDVGTKRRAQEVKGDLDSIVMKAIQFDVENRYSSVYEFAEDLRRYMRCEPIRAKNNSYFYLARRFTRRNRSAVLLVAAFTCVFVAIAIAQQARILHERDTAIAERQKFEQTHEFLESMFDQANPESSSQKDVLVRDILDRGVKTIRHKFDQQPDVKVSLLTSMARAYEGLELRDTAYELHVESLALQDSFYGGATERTAVTLTNMASLLSLKDALAQAKVYLGRAREVYDELKQPKPENISYTLSVDGDISYRAGEYDNALVSLEKALAIRQEYLSSDDPILAHNTLQIGQAYEGMGDYDKAQKYFNKALDIKLQSPQEDQLLLGKIYNNIAVIYHVQGQFEQALNYYQLCIEAREQLLGAESPGLVIPYNNVGAVYALLGQYDLAENYHNKAMLALNNEGQAESFYRAMTYHGLAGALAGKQDYQPALELLQKSLEIQKRMYSDNLNHPRIANVYDEFGHIYKQMGNLALSKEYYQKSLAIVTLVYGAEHEATKIAAAKLEEINEF